MMEDAKQSNTQRHRTLEGYKEANEKMQTVLSMQSDSLQAARSALAHRQAEVASLKTSLDEAETRAAQTEEKSECILMISDLPPPMLSTSAFLQRFDYLLPSTL